VADCGFSQSSLGGWTRKNIEEGVKQAAHALMDPKNCEWREINQAYRIDLAHECRTRDMSYVTGLSLQMITALLSLFQGSTSARETWPEAKHGRSSI